MAAGAQAPKPSSLHGVFAEPLSLLAVGLLERSKSEAMWMPVPEIPEQPWHCQVA